MRLKKVIFSSFAMLMLMTCIFGASNFLMSKVYADVNEGYIIKTSSEQARFDNLSSGLQIPLYGDGNTDTKEGSILVLTVGSIVESEFQPLVPNVGDTITFLYSVLSDNPIYSPIAFTEEGSTTISTTKTITEGVESFSISFNPYEKLPNNGIGQFSFKAVIYRTPTDTNPVSQIVQTVPFEIEFLGFSLETKGVKISTAKDIENPDNYLVYLELNGKTIKKSDYDKSRYQIQWIIIKESDNVEFDTFVKEHNPTPLVVDYFSYYAEFQKLKNQDVNIYNTNQIKMEGPDAGKYKIYSMIRKADKNSVFLPIATSPIPQTMNVLPDNTTMLFISAGVAFGLIALGVAIVTIVKVKSERVW